MAIEDEEFESEYNTDATHMDDDTDMGQDQNDAASANVNNNSGKSSTKRGRETTRLTTAEKFAINQGESILISDEEQSPDGTVSFLTLEKFLKKHSRLPNREDLAERSVLIKSRGSYLPRPNYMRSLMDKDEPDWQKRAATALAAFTKEGKERGFGDQAFASEYLRKRSQRFRPFNYETPAGMRAKTRDYVNPVQAGQANPDMLIRNPDGIFLAVYPKLQGELDNMSLDDAKDHLEKRGVTQLFVKTRDNTYMTPEVCDRTLGENAAKTIYGSFVDRAPIVERPDRPWALVSDQSGHFVDLARIEDATARALIGGGAAVLVRTPNGKSYVQPNRLRAMDKSKGSLVFREIMKNAGLSPGLADQQQPTITRDVIGLPDENNKPTMTGLLAPSDLKNDRIFIQTRTKDGRPSGTFIDVPTATKSVSARTRALSRWRAGMERGTDQRPNHGSPTSDDTHSAPPAATPRPYSMDPPTDQAKTLRVQRPHKHFRRELDPLSRGVGSSVNDL